MTGLRMGRTMRQIRDYLQAHAERPVTVTQLGHALDQTPANLYGSMGRLAGIYPTQLERKGPDSWVWHGQREIDQDGPAEGSLILLRVLLRDSEVFVAVDDETGQRFQVRPWALK